MRGVVAANVVIRLMRHHKTWNSCPSWCPSLFCWSSSFPSSSGITFRFCTTIASRSCQQQQQQQQQRGATITKDVWVPNRAKTGRTYLTSLRSLSLDESSRDRSFLPFAPLSCNSNGATFSTHALVAHAHQARTVWSIVPKFVHKIFLCLVFWSA